jgi:hypothetical protein
LETGLHTFTARRWSASFLSMEMRVHSFNTTIASARALLSDALLTNYISCFLVPQHPA